jgi:hypothetical protein
MGEAMIDLATVDPDKVQPSWELDALIDIEWMGNSQFAKAAGLVPEYTSEHWEYGPDGEGPFYVGLPYSTNSAHAGEARRKTERSFVEHSDGVVRVSIGYVVGGQVRWHSAKVLVRETKDDKGKAEALATCKAIAFAITSHTAGGASGGATDSAVESGQDSAVEGTQ